VPPSKPGPVPTLVPVPTVGPLPTVGPVPTEGPVPTSGPVPTRGPAGELSVLLSPAGGAPPTKPIGKQLPGTGGAIWFVVVATLLLMAVVPLMVVPFVVLSGLVSAFA